MAQQNGKLDEAFKAMQSAVLLEPGNPELKRLLGETLGRGTARLLEAQEQAWSSLERTAAVLAARRSPTGRG